LKTTAIIPTFNRAYLVKDAINSVQNQTYKVDEIIIVDDGSTDNTQEILKEFKNIHVIKTKNLGVSHARNIGIKNAGNDWLVFLDSDDTWMEDKIQKQVNFHKKNRDILFSHTGEKWIRDGKKIKYPNSLKKPSGECFLENISTCKISASSILTHKSIFEKIGYFDENLSVCEDYDIWLRISYRYKIGLLKDELIIKYAGHPQLSSTIFAIDRYHIYSLEKFLNSIYKDEVKKEIIKKCNILIKGAKKHNNQEILEKYLKVIRNIQN
jgi:glycosyltransferase involved in cell wall biosynthesis